VTWMYRRPPPAACHGDELAGENRPQLAALLQNVVDRTAGLSVCGGVRRASSTSDGLGLER
jgi:hypothetical protein